MVSRLGDFTPVLELLFATNLALGVWDRVVLSLVQRHSDRLAERIKLIKVNQIDSTDDDDVNAFEQVTKRLTAQWESRSQVVIRRGQIAGVLIAMVVFLIVACAGYFPNAEINVFSILAGIVLFSLPLPITGLFLYFALNAYQKEVDVYQITFDALCNARNHTKERAEGVMSAFHGNL